jgi:hypothetical protein
MVSGTLSSAAFGDVADRMIGPRFDPVLKSKPSFYRIALRSRRRPGTPVGGDERRGRLGRGASSLPVNPGFIFRFPWRKGGEPGAPGRCVGGFL